MTSYANNQVSVSTDYSKIIIEHTTQYEQEWSDIKRRKKWERKISNDDGSKMKGQRKTDGLTPCTKETSTSTSSCYS